MPARNNRWIFVLPAALLVVVFAILSLPGQVTAAQPVNAARNSCFACHEDLYYLHDLGKFYCITEHKDRCVNCHDGDATAMKKDAAHMGLVLHPQINDGAKCQECHAQDAQERIAKFASVGGFKAVLVAEPYTPSVTTPRGLHDGTEVNPIAENWPWLGGALVVFGLWLLLVMFSPAKP